MLTTEEPAVAAIQRITSTRGRYVRSYLDPKPGQHPCNAPYLSVTRSRTHLHAALDRVDQPSDFACAAADTLARIGVLRVIAATGTRRSFIYGAGTYTTVHALRTDEAAVLATLAALDKDNTDPALDLALRWSSDVPQLAQRRTARSRAWLVDQLAGDLATLAILERSRAGRSHHHGPVRSDVCVHCGRGPS